MPEDRLIHRRCLQSDRVANLTDFEFRVWMTYELAADDYGVMRFSAAALRSANDALEHKPTKILLVAFQRLVSVGLIRTFEHQGKAYVYQHDWQYWQHVTRPRHSLFPLPPLDFIEGCEESTRLLFHERLESSGASVAVSSKTLGNSINDAASNADHPPPRVKRLTADGDRQSANGKSLRDRFDEFWANYPRRVGKGAAWRTWVKLKPDNALLVQMLATLEWQTRDPNWLKDGGNYIPHPTTWLNQERWTDKPVELPQMSERTTRQMKAIYGE